MAEREWNPKIGDKVYCVCEYYTSDYTMRYKGLEGFRNYGIEVVESKISVQVEKWWARLRICVLTQRGGRQCQ